MQSLASPRAANPGTSLRAPATFGVRNLPESDCFVLVDPVQKVFWNWLQTRNVCKAMAAVTASSERHVRCPLCREPVTLAGEASATFFS